MMIYLKILQCQKKESQRIVIGSILQEEKNNLENYLLCMSVQFNQLKTILITSNLIHQINRRMLDQTEIDYLRYLLLRIQSEVLPWITE